MEKLYRIKLLVSLLMFIVTIGYGQEKFVVLKTSGNPILSTIDTIMEAKKGMIISIADKLSLSRKDTVIYIDHKGSIFKLNRIGKYSHRALSRKKHLPIKSSFLTKYLKYVWAEFAMINDRTLNKGVVYRGQDGLMLFPTDSLRISAGFIDFSWKKQAEHEGYYYLVVKSGESEKLIKIGTLGTELRLFVDEHQLKQGESYQWTVLESNYIDPVNTIWSRFRLLTITETEDVLNEIKEVADGLNELGMPKDKVLEDILSDYNLFLRLDKH